MADISEWSPVDESNTAAPPNGFPEFMAPSGINNAARAMMGAIRRWYDTVNAQLATFLPLSGGTVAGTVYAASFLAGGPVVGNPVNSNGNFGVAGSGNINGDLGVGGTVFAHAFTDTDGALSVFDKLRELEARVAELESR